MMKELQTQIVQQTTETHNSETTRLKSQAELFTELMALERIAEMAQMAIEGKLSEIVDNLGHTFKHDGSYKEAPVLQIRTRHNNKLNRSVPYIVALKEHPRNWLNKTGSGKVKVVPVEQVTNTETTEDVVV